MIYYLLCTALIFHTKNDFIVFSYKFTYVLGFHIFFFLCDFKTLNKSLKDKENRVKFLHLDKNIIYCFISLLVTLHFIYVQCVN